jgi:predicted transcriptional regulator
MNKPADEPSLHTTTVRFDPDLWARLGLAAEELAVARSALIRDATREHVTRMEYEDRLAALEEQVHGLAGSVAMLSKRLRQHRV